MDLDEHDATDDVQHPFGAYICADPQRHRPADDDRDPYGAFEHDLVEFVRKHHPGQLSVYFGRRAYSSFHLISGDHLSFVDYSTGERHTIPVD